MVAENFELSLISNMFRPELLCSPKWLTSAVEFIDTGILLLHGAGSLSSTETPQLRLRLDG